MQHFWLNLENSLILKERHEKIKTSKHACFKENIKILCKLNISQDYICVRVT